MSGISIKKCKGLYDKCYNKKYGQECADTTFRSFTFARIHKSRLGSPGRLPFFKFLPSSLVKRTTDTDRPYGSTDELVGDGSTLKRVGKHLLTFTGQLAVVRECYRTEEMFKTIASYRNPHESLKQRFRIVKAFKTVLNLVREIGRGLFEVRGGKRWESVVCMG